MPLFNWPYTNLHSLNLDWIIKKIKNVETAETNTAASKEAAAGSAASAAESEANAAKSETNAATSATAAGNYYNQIRENVSTLVTGWMNEHITPTTPPVDDTLTISGAAADALVTGNRTTSLMNAVDSLINNPLQITPNVIIGGIRTDGQNSGDATLNTKRARTQYIQITPGAVYMVSLNSDSFDIINAHTYTSNSQNTHVRKLELLNLQALIFHADATENYLRVCYKARDEHELTEADLTSIQSATAFYTFTDASLTLAGIPADAKATGDRLRALESPIDPETDSYVIGPDLLQRKMKVERVGSGALKYGQSFLIYNDKYYSTDGSHIAVQSADFTVEQDVTISVGHGNSFCLGNGNKGYVSGWDDNKIYVVNLDTLTIESEITLPTTGYTTCAIDETNSIAYIFQRETRPNTESKYNVIAYDWMNQKTLYINETTISFGAMQSCVLFNDRIIALNGLGTAALPNGYRIYNTKGEILADYFIPSFANTEPEGVFIDKSTGALYVSLVTKKVYKLSAL